MSQRFQTHPLVGQQHGPRLTKDGCEFRVWAPKAKSVTLQIVGPVEKSAELTRESHGYWSVKIGEAAAGWRYRYLINGKKSRPDPASRSQPDGVHEASELLGTGQFSWSDEDWHGVPLNDLILYELHVGTFTSEGTFRAAIRHLDRLTKLGITSVELMPVAQFPGSRNWGYDGVYPFAVQNSYGGVDGLREFVDACHQRGIAVVLDVVYNHVGPEGNYLADFGPYFTGKYRTPWGEAFNFDGPHSDEVKQFFFENALMWFSDFHIDGLRLDAAHAIFDQTAEPFLRQLGLLTCELSELQNRPLHLIAESNLNDPRMVNCPSVGGHGLDAQWVDDFHHSLHVALTGEKAGYYEDFNGIEDLVTSMESGYVFTGQYSNYRGRQHGKDRVRLCPKQVVVSAQNHDQVGNRLRGDRLSSQLSVPQRKLAAAIVLLSPYTPMLFQGEEYGESAPFCYFISHSDSGLIESVRRGRKREFAHFGWSDAPFDPQDEETFRRCILDQSLAEANEGKELQDFYTTLIRLRRSLPALRFRSRRTAEVFSWPQHGCFALHRWSANEHVMCVFNLSDTQTQLPNVEVRGVERSRWELLLTTESNLEAEELDFLTIPAWSFVVWNAR